MNVQLHHGDCLDVLRAMPDNSVDSVVTDPPYGLSFMGKRWDYDVPATDVWAECLRVLKPGGHLLAFAGTRTQHRMAVRIEDAGFEIRDMIAWVYGSGFPKSHNGDWGGTALKPALEPITMARKPLVGTVAANVLEHGTGALNIDGCRIPVDPLSDASQLRTMTRNVRQDNGGWGMSTIRADAPTVVRAEGRWPANLIHDGSDEVLAWFPESKSGAMKATTQRAAQDAPGSVCYGTYGGAVASSDIKATSGSAARFFYCAKASRADRNEGLDGFTAKSDSAHRKTNLETADNPYLSGVTKRMNSHPTVKPTDLMAYLVRLVTPPGGIVLDPFMGSGSTGKAAMREGMRFIGIERDAGYFEIARCRVVMPIQRGLEFA